MSKVPLEPAGPGFVDAPVALAGEAVVGVFASLQSRGTAGGAGASPVEPVAVAFERTIDDGFINFNTIACRELAGFLPGIAFHTKELYIERVAAVRKQPVAGFVKQISLKIIGAWCIVHATFERIPPEFCSFSKNKLRVVCR